MKITAVTPHIMWGGDAGGFQFSSTLWGRGAGRNWLFVKVETDAGVHGWGEASLVNQTPAIAASVELLGRQIMGQDPAGIERIWQIMYLQTATGRRGDQLPWRHRSGAGGINGRC